MKKKNLNFLLALLAALALVFAGACSDGSDDDGSSSGDSPSSSNDSPETPEVDYSIYSGTTYSVDPSNDTASTADDSGKRFLREVALAFDSGSSNGVTLTAEWQVGSGNAGEYSNDKGTASLSGTYTVGDGYKVTAIFSGAGASDGNTDASLVLTVPADYQSGTPASLTLDSTASALYVTDSLSESNPKDTVNLFDASSDFALNSGDTALDTNATLTLEN